jgi:ABC-2 type transport system ATP-binding protein
MIDGPAAIAVTGLSKRFGAKTVVDAVDLSVLAGEIYGFLGPNGSGKTTFIRMLCGLLTPDAGEGTCLGYDVRRESDAIKRTVGYMTQRFSLWDDLTVRENLDFVGRMYGVRGRREAVQHTLAQYGLADRADQLAGTLSGGWKQRLALAACLLHRPRLLLLDEPTAGVDPTARREFWEELHRLSADGVTILVSTHYMDEAERCHRLAYLAYGHLLAKGTAADIIGAAGIVTWTIDGAGAVAREALARTPGVEGLASFGTTLHVTGTDAAQLAQSVPSTATRLGLVATPMAPSLEDAFIHLMQRSTHRDAS